MKAYYDYMVDVVQVFGAEPVKAKTELLEVLEFETKLANVGFPLEL